MKDERVLQGLIAKRAELAAMIEGTQMSLRQMIADLDSMDNTIHVFDPDMDLEEVRPKALPARHAGFKGEVARAVLKVLREAKAPLGSRAIAVQVMTERGLSLADRQLVNVVKKRVGACLRHNRERGIVRSAIGADRTAAWEVAR